uniref:Copia protein n=1 Tax=Cajanus cajan TaxID=3821 RepID=A0A151TFP7_CAJCA|nr:Copia protein [Cajanus cajan]KYP65843.1 Copia protein [Cajanus cajan]
MNPNMKLWEEGSVPIDVGRYRSLVDKLIYLSHTWPVIAFFVKKKIVKGMFARSVIDKKSISGNCIYVWGNLVTWGRKKQGVVARSSAGAKFRAMAKGICERLWICIVLEVLEMAAELSLMLYCGSKAVVSIAHNLV